MVTLTSVAGVQRETTSDASRALCVFALFSRDLSGNETEKAGFGKTTAQGVVARITETTNLDIRLEIASQKAVVEVMVQPDMVQTENAGAGHRHRAGADPAAAAANQEFSATSDADTGDIRSGAELFGVGRGAAPILMSTGIARLRIRVIINGADANSIGTGSLPNLAIPATDTLQEFIVQTSQYDASQGRVSGGVVAAVTKSGTNHFMATYTSFSATPRSTRTTTF